MSYVLSEVEDGIATLTLAKGKVNALNEAMIDEIHARFKAVETDSTVKTVVLTAQGKFFCFGFDIPELMSYPKEAFTRHLAKVADLYAYLFTYPKPVIASLNGHTTAGGCVLALTSDYRIMARGKGKIGLTEINLGSTLTISAILMLKHCLGSAKAEKLAYSGALLTSEEALGLGLINETADLESLGRETMRVARGFAEKDGNAFRSIKMGLRGPVAEEMRKLQQSSIQEFADIWYSENTRKNLENVRIFA